MPLPNDPELVKVAYDLVNELQAIGGKHPGFRTSTFVFFISLLSLKRGVGLLFVGNPQMYLLPYLIFSAFEWSH